jgi:hypothetical protein
LNVAEHKECVGIAQDVRHLKTAKARRLTILLSRLQQADEVIQ